MYMYTWTSHLKREPLLKCISKSSVPGIRRKSSRVRKPFCCLSSEVNRDHRRSIWDDVTGNTDVNSTLWVFWNSDPKKIHIKTYTLSPEISRQCHRGSGWETTSSFPSWIFLLQLRILQVVSPLTELFYGVCNEFYDFLTFFVVCTLH